MDKEIIIKNNNKINKLKLEYEAMAHLIMQKDSVLYVDLKDNYTKNGVIKKQIWLSDLINDYKGPPIYFDFDENDILLGIEFT